MSPQEKTLREILIDGIGARGLTPERLAELADVPPRYLTALCEGDAAHLPPAPYIRGYLTQIGNFLNLDGQSLWRLYKEEYSSKASGVNDVLPANRFAIRSFNKKNIFFIVAIIAIIYGAWRLPSFFGKPPIEIISPDSSPVLVKSSPVVLAGRVNPGDTVTVNNENITVDAEGRFEKEWPVEPGVNVVEFTAKRFLGRETKATRQIIYQP